jgi:hypothetical protein
MTRAEIEAILAEVTYKDWQFHVGDKNGTLFLQVRFRRHDPVTGRREEGWQHGRKWQLSEFMVKGEVVQTALKAALTAEEYECREAFRYRGEPIFGPHFDLDALWQLCREKRFEYRSPPGPAAPP